MVNPSVSVIIPAFNRAHAIKTAIDSVLAQDYENWELIIVDDGSTDNTKKTVNSIKDGRINYLYKQNGGPAAARNYGAKRARGQWIMYLDSDDELFPACISTMLDWVSKHPETVFAFPRSLRTYVLYENGVPVKSVDDSADTPEKFTIEDIFERRAGFSPNGFMHLRKIFEENLRWDEKCPLMEDWEFMLSIGKKYPDGFLYVPLVLQKYTQRFGHDNLVSKTTYGSWADAFDYIYKKHKADKTQKNQTWYPLKAEKWRKRQREFEAGERPPYRLHYFEAA